MWYFVELEGAIPRLPLLCFSSLLMTDLSLPVAIQISFLVHPACNMREIVYLCSRVKCFLFFIAIQSKNFFLIIAVVMTTAMIFLP
jgi:hypothetical protein